MIIDGFLVQGLRKPVPPAVRPPMTLDQIGAALARVGENLARTLKRPPVQSDFELQ